MYFGYVVDQDGCPHLIYTDRDIPNIVSRFYVTESADHKLCFSHFDQLATHVVVATFNGHSDLRNGNIVSQ